MEFLITTSIFLSLISIIILFLIAMYFWFKNGKKISKLNWPNKTGHNEFVRDKFDRHGRRFCKKCENYHNGSCE